MASSPLTEPAPQRREVDLEIKDAQLIFDSVWAELEDERGRENLTFPREIFWLNGAPGAGKGTQTRFIMEYCGLTARPIVVSDLLDSPEARRLKDAGMMVGDREVTSLLFRRLLEPSSRTGVVVDGYPRTKVQVECLKHFHQKRMELRRDFLNTKLEERFPKPIFHIVVLYVDEQVSVHRQLQRGREAQQLIHEAEIRGETVNVEVRKTDLKPDAARNRYRTFKEITYESLKSLRDIFHYHFVNAAESIEEVQQRIVRELTYQSSLELDETTFDLISQLPIAPRIVLHARQELVKRLDNYALHQRELFQSVLDLISEKFMPIIIRHAVSGMARVNSEDTIFSNPITLAMVIDVFSERGFHAMVDLQKQEIPDRFDLETGRIRTRTKKVYQFSIHFPGSVIRRGR